MKWAEQSPHSRTNSATSSRFRIFSAYSDFDRFLQFRRSSSFGGFLDESVCWLYSLRDFALLNYREVAISPLFGTTLAFESIRNRLKRVAFGELPFTRRTSNSIGYTDPTPVSESNGLMYATVDKLEIDFASLVLNFSQSEPENL